MKNLNQIACLSAFLTLSSLALANEGKEEFLLQSIEIQGSSKEEAGIHRYVSKENIQNHLAQDAKEALMLDPSINIGGGARNAQRIYLRGIEGSNLNITVDGAKQGRSLFQHRGDMLGIDPFLLKKITVSPLSDGTQGGGALGGAVALESIDAQDMLEDERGIGMALRGGYMSASKGKSGGVSLFGRFDNTGLLVDVSGQNLDDYRSGSGKTVPNTATKDQNIFAKLTFVDIGGHTLKASLSSHKNSGHYVTGGPGSDFGIAPKNKATSFQEMGRDSYTLGHTFNLSPYLNMQNSLYFNKRTLENKSSKIDVTSENLGGSIKNKSTFALGNLRNSLTLGIDYDSEDGKSRVSSGKFVMNNAKTFGAFVSADSAIAGFGVTYGARLDDFRSEFGTRNISDSALSPHAGIRYEIIDNLTVFAKYSEAIRASGVIPVQWMANITAATNYNDGKSFKPEKSKNKEAGVKYQILNNGNSMRIGVSVFENEIKNLIERVGGGSGSVAKIWNNPRALISKGYEVRVAWDREHFSSSLGYTHTRLKDDMNNNFTSSRRVASSAGDRLVLDTSYWVIENLRIGYTLNAIKGLSGVYNKKRSGYALHDIYAEYVPLSGLTLSMAIKNLLDRSYYEHTSIEQGDTILEESGREFRIFARYQF